MVHAVKYKGLAVHKPNEKFELWEYEPAPLEPTHIEIKVWFPFNARGQEAGLTEVSTQSYLR